MTTTQPTTNPPTTDQAPQPSSSSSSSSETTQPTTTATPNPPTVTSEHEILARLKEIRNQLFNLRGGGYSVAASNPATPAPKGNKKDLNRLYKEVSFLVKTLATLRASKIDRAAAGVGSQSQTSSSSNDDLYADENGHNAADQVIEDIVPMFFQFWSGGSSSSKPLETPTSDSSSVAAASSHADHMYPLYVKLAKMKHQLEVMQETGLVTMKDLHAHKASLKVLEVSVASLRAAKEAATANMSASTGSLNKSSSSNKDGSAVVRVGPGLALVEAKLKACHEVLTALETDLNSIAPALIPVHNRLVEIKAELTALLGRRSAHAFSLAEVQILQDELREIDSVRIDGKYYGKDGSVLPGQAAVIFLMEQCFDEVHELIAMRDSITGENPLREVYEKLIRIKGRLERALAVSRWSIRSEDLVPIQMELGEIDNLRVDGKFMSSEDPNGTVPEGQAVLHYLLHKCYRIIYKLQVSAEPVSDPLMPVYTQLKTIHRCLVELQKWNVNLSGRELALYQVRLAAIDNKRVDGKFLDDEGGVPEGQGTLHALLESCYELMSELHDYEGEEEDDYEDEEEEEESEN